MVMGCKKICKNVLFLGLVAAVDSYRLFDRAGLAAGSSRSASSNAGTNSHISYQKPS